ncbi:MAG: hypothetical protein WA956_09275 [Stenotrophomonas sp.]
MQQHPHRHLLARTLLRAGLHLSVLVLLAMLTTLLQGQGPALSDAVADPALAMHVGGDEAPAGEFTAKRPPAKLRRAAPLQASRTAASRPSAPILPPACMEGLAPVMLSTVPAAPPACPPATPLRWRLQHGQAPPLA